MAEGADLLSKIPLEKLALLLKLPLLLNSSLDTRQVVGVAMQHLKNSVGADACTTFLLNETGSELLFWSLQGKEATRLKNVKMRADKGIVGWVIKEQKSVRINDAASDPRFFKEIDSEGKFSTKSVLCVPLTARGSRKLGAIQALNKKDEAAFSEEDLLIAEQLGHQLSLAIDNSRLYEESVKRGQMLEKLSQRKDEMISVITHEFRTPLSIIQGSADLLASGLADSSSGEQIAQSLLTGVKRLTSLIAEIRNIGKLQDKELKPKLQPTELKPILEDICSRLKIHAEGRQIELSLSCDERSGPVQCDGSLITVVLYNLIANAIRFTPNGGKISLSATRQAGLVEIAVTDTGIGIDQSEFALIYEKFYEVGSASKHSSGTFEFKSGGLGLGLPVAKQIVEAHGSTLDVKSVLGKGSTFSFRLNSA